MEAAELKLREAIRVLFEGSANLPVFLTHRSEHIRDLYEKVIGKPPMWTRYLNFCKKRREVDDPSCYWTLHGFAISVQNDNSDIISFLPIEESADVWIYRPESLQKLRWANEARGAGSQPPTLVECVLLVKDLIGAACLVTLKDLKKMMEFAGLPSTVILDELNSNRISTQYLIRLKHTDLLLWTSGLMKDARTFLRNDILGRDLATLLVSFPFIPEFRLTKWYTVMFGYPLLWEESALSAQCRNENLDKPKRFGLWLDTELAQYGLGLRKSRDKIFVAFDMTGTGVGCRYRVMMVEERKRRIKALEAKQLNDTVTPKTEMQRSRIDVHVKNVVPPGCIVSISDLESMMRELDGEVFTGGAGSLHDAIRDYEPASVEVLYHQNARYKLDGIRMRETEPTKRIEEICHYPLTRAPEEGKLISAGDVDVSISWNEIREVMLEVLRNHVNSVQVLFTPPELCKLFYSVTGAVLPWKRFASNIDVFVMLLKDDARFEVVCFWDGWIERILEFFGRYDDNTQALTSGAPPMYIFVGDRRNVLRFQREHPVDGVAEAMHVVFSKGSTMSLGAIAAVEAAINGYSETVWGLGPSSRRLEESDGNQPAEDDST
ncbi:hypothetical protein BJ742DRAFT_891187 [Cladochytrium replicatum]|nr:hypothetical protein BJ742DRAFT_891187 [Cladochytrium replicatum]